MKKMNLEKKKTIIGLKRKAKEEKKAFWRDIAERLEKPSRRMISVNLEKLGKLAAKNPGKTLVVPGKVLGKGELEGKARVAALAFSKKALEEIQKKGEAIYLNDLIKGKEAPSNMVIVK